MNARSVPGLRFARLSLLFACMACGLAGAQTRVTDGQGLSVKAECGVLTVRPIADGALRVRCTPDGKDAPPSLILIHPNHAVAFKVRQDRDAVTLRTARMAARLNLDTMALEFEDSKGAVLLQEKPYARRVHLSAVQDQPTFAVEDSFVSPPDEHLYGAGQFQDGYLDIRNLPRHLLQFNTQIALPFVLSSKGYGILWHNDGLTDLNPADNTLPLTMEQASGAAPAKNNRPVPAAFDGELTIPSSGEYAFLLDSGRMQAARYHIEIDGKTLFDFSNQWLPPTTSWLLPLNTGTHHVHMSGIDRDQPVLHWRATADQTVFRSPVAEGTDYVVFAGPKLDDVIASYRAVSGQAPLMPLWAYGFFQCRERYASSDAIVAAAKEFREHDLPMDVMVQDWMYWGKYGWNAMQWDEQNYPDPAGMARQLHDLHAKLMVSVWSRIDPKSVVGSEFAAKNLFLPGTQWVDFFNPRAAALYWKNMSTRMLPLGIDAWWLDATEPENDALAHRMTAQGPGEIHRLAYPLLVSRTVYEGQRKDAPGQRVFILTRSAFLGQQRYASAVWSGDVGANWETLRREVKAGMNYSVSGLPYWTTDTGGFFRAGDSQYKDPAFHELFLRWLQFSTFSPLMRVHGGSSRTEPWNYGKDVEDEERQYLDLRYRLLPYVYSEAAQVTFHGSTLMRPLVMDFPGDETALRQADEYMFGPSFLVAPVLEPGAHSRPVYAPSSPGGWYDWWTEKPVQGGQTVVQDAPLEKIPLLIKAGSIVPVGPVVQWTEQAKGKPLELRVYPGADGDFVLYEDEGTNYNYETGKFAEIPMHWDQQHRQLTLGARRGVFPGMAAQRTFTVHLAGDAPGSDRKVIYSGNRVNVSFLRQ